MTHSPSARTMPPRNEAASNRLPFVAIDVEVEMSMVLVAKFSKEQRQPSILQ